MSKPALLIIIVLVVLIIGFGIFYLTTRPDYGNDTAGIEKIIMKNGGGETPVLLTPVDLSGSRYVGFFEGEDTIGLLVLIGDGRGNYVYENIYRVDGSGIAVFYEPYHVDVVGTHGVDIIVSKNPALERILRFVDGVEELEKEVEPGTSTITAMEIHSEESQLSVAIQCYDMNGDEITDIKAHDIAVNFDI